MKKYILLFLFVPIVLACSKNLTEEKEEIIGTEQFLNSLQLIHSQFNDVRT